VEEKEGGKIGKVGNGRMSPGGVGKWSKQGQILSCVVYLHSLAAVYCVYVTGHWKEHFISFEMTIK
jgi:hypothetical protein